MRGSWAIYANIVNLHDINPNKFKEDEYGIELGLTNHQTNKVEEVKIFINDIVSKRTKEECEKKIQHIKLKHGYS